MNIVIKLIFFKKKRARDIGAIRISNWMPTIPKISPKDLPAFRVISIRRSFGAATAKSIFSKVCANNSL